MSEERVFGNRAVGMWPAMRCECDVGPCLLAESERRALLYIALRAPAADNVPS